MKALIFAIGVFLVFYLALTIWGNTHRNEIQIITPISSNQPAEVKNEAVPPVIPSILGTNLQGKG